MDKGLDSGAPLLTLMIHWVVMDQCSESASWWFAIVLCHLEKVGIWNALTFRVHLGGSSLRGLINQTKSTGCLN